MFLCTLTAAAARLASEGYRGRMRAKSCFFVDGETQILTSTQLPTEMKSSTSTSPLFQINDNVAMYIEVLNPLQVQEEEIRRGPGRRGG